MNEISLRHTDEVGILEIGTPPGNKLQRPAFTSQLLLEQFIIDNKLKGLIITGMGRNFSTGADPENISDLSQNPELLQIELSEGIVLLSYIRNLNIPVIAAINRLCFGGGLEIALACHIRVASENALFAFPESNHGLIPGLNGTIRLPDLIGLARAMQMILSGDTMDAQMALQTGMIDHLAPKDGALDYALALMNKMVHGRPHRVIHAVMQSLTHRNSLSEKEAAEEETRLFCQLARQMNSEND